MRESEKNCCPNSLFLFVGVSLFFLSQFAIPSEQEQRRKRSEPKPSRASTQSSLPCSLYVLFFSCCFFVVNTSNRSISLLRILFDYLILALVLYIDSRPNVLVVLHHGKLSFFFRYSKRFLPSLHLFTFDTWMNEHQIGWSLFVGVFPLEYRGLCLHRRQPQ